MCRRVAAQQARNTNSRTFIESNQNHEVSRIPIKVTSFRNAKRSYEGTKMAQTLSWSGKVFTPVLREQLQYLCIDHENWSITQELIVSIFTLGAKPDAPGFQDLPSTSTSHTLLNYRWTTTLWELVLLPRTSSWCTVIQRYSNNI
ncbi:hypothetical protein C8R44DRAFT_725781 [Mycena epipterygia]|nr:hypothetical protein C8R44DRAFT_725781 [Mycena epipterygia]